MLIESYIKDIDIRQLSYDIRCYIKTTLKNININSPVLTIFKEAIIELRNAFLGVLLNKLLSRNSSMKTINDIAKKCNIDVNANNMRGEINKLCQRFEEIKKESQNAIQEPFLLIRILIDICLDINNFKFYYDNEYLYLDYILRCLDNKEFLFSEDSFNIYEFFKRWPFIPKIFIYEDIYESKPEVYDVVTTSYHLENEWRNIFNILIDLQSKEDSTLQITVNNHDMLSLVNSLTENTILVKELYFTIQTIIKGVVKDSISKNSICDNKSFK